MGAYGTPHVHGPTRSADFIVTVVYVCVNDLCVRGCARAMI